jgi:hypothetical protein
VAQTGTSLRNVSSVDRMNLRVTGSRISGVTVASVTRGRGDEPDLAGAVHQILATLTNVRRDTSAAELRDRVALVQWLRIELAAVETLLTASCGRRAGSADANPRADRTG